MKIAIIKTTFVLIFSLLGCLQEALALQLNSTAFSNHGQIPVQYTCDGKNVSPPLSWSDVPAGTKSFVLIMDNPDAPKGTWVHWMLFNIANDTTLLSEKLITLPSGAKEGANSAGQLHYHGPCPPWGEHRYFFKLYALDSVLALDSGATKDQLEAAMQNHILEQASLLGTYIEKVKK